MDPGTGCGDEDTGTGRGDEDRTTASADDGVWSSDGRGGRRRFLRSVAAATVGGGLAAILGNRDIVQPVAAADLARREAGTLDVDASTDTDAVFPQSVMSGGPTPSGAIVWTRLSPAAAARNGTLVCQVASDPDFDDAVVSRVVPDGRFSARHDHVVQVDLDGELAADSYYYYRFVYDGTPTRTGRLRTLPEPDATPDSLRVAVVSCQDYQNGYYGAFHHIAEEDVDYVLHLGDFIYESANGQYTTPGRRVPDDRALSLPSGRPLAETLDDFRYLYNQYKRDRFLQSTLERHTLVAGWDDHEIGNNRYWDYVTDAPVLPAKRRGRDPEFAMDLTANGIQAWVEHMPMRVDYDPDADHLHDQLRLWRRVQFGDLVDLAVTDERLFRDGPPCEEGRVVWCFEEDARGRTMLGREQRRWWKEWTANSTATWTVWLNEVLTMPLTQGEGWNQIEFLHDAWDGFQHERHRLMRHLRRRGPRNFVTLTGDLHCAMAGVQHAHYGEFGRGDRGPRVGVEFLAPAVSSTNAADVFSDRSWWDRTDLHDLVREENEHLSFVNWHEHGYAVVEFTDAEATYTAYAVDASENSPDATRRELATYVVPDGRPKLRRRS
ncbi:alkaline phosphatase D family protein [Halorubellus salinus]|uniref:alkaline phosphatase D family protein n=1 Tax=Halorubellus salinus TaxID=755309 RepID=UPI001D0874AB|nr:alkaline phosphatase D family protein [Halorubellus salinus]